MRLAEQDEEDGIGVTLAKFRNLGRGVPVACTDLAQIFARHAVEAVYGFRVIARGGEQFVKGAPIVSPVEVKADTLAKFGLVNFAAPPFVEDVLVAGKDGFNSQNHGTVSGERALLDQRCSMALRGGQRVIVPDEDDVGGVESTLNLLGIQDGVVAAVCFVELAKIFATAVRILGANFALDSGLAIYASLDF